MLSSPTLEQCPPAAISAVAYLEGRRARRLSAEQIAPPATPAPASRLAEARRRYESHVLAWHALGRHAEADAAWAELTRLS